MMITNARSRSQLELNWLLRGDRLGRGNRAEENVRVSFTLECARADRDGLASWKQSTGSELEMNFFLCLSWIWQSIMTLGSLECFPSRGRDAPYRSNLWIGIEGFGEI